MVQDEVGWVLETIKSNYPVAWPTDDEGDPELYRINRDEPETLETGERSKTIELTKASAIGASLANRDTQPVGTEYDHRVETTISCRLEGVTGRSGEFGRIDSAAGFEQLVRYIQHAINAERSYPTVDDVGQDDIGSVAYHSLFVENETDLSHEERDYFRRDWDVRFVGFSSLP
ncbi:hypothetical protein [Natrinema halophilum]|uniref:Uncharacterized protein n=1 Tax=Natrinema halophilum TaxID=1699371 RepID=A0A7D5H5A1_9EURY|nr:hypothetical protein [Natrinema halophilum]QLG47895.1 hypothetical protein HYG82_03060 [Natrinema halophilum]